jgi:ketosteroid isomerase-like protein
MKVVAFFCAVLCVCAVCGTAQKSAKPNGEEGRIIALESAWDQAEQNKDTNALSNLLADSLVYVEYDGSLSNKQQFLASVRSADITSEQINNEGVTVHLYNNNVAVSTGIYRDKGIEKGKSFQRRGRFTNVWMNQNGSWQCISSQSTLIAH